MTTVAWDGTTLASDSLAVDPWGLTSRADKIFEGTGFILGFAGPHGPIINWWRKIQTMPVSWIIEHGYTDYEREHNAPSMILVTPHKAYKLDGPVFLEIEAPYHAIGSGRDFAIAAMHLGKTAEEAVMIASHFDNNTDSRVQKFVRPL